MIKKKRFDKSAKAPKTGHLILRHCFFARCIGFLSIDKTINTYSAGCLYFGKVIEMLLTCLLRIDRVIEGLSTTCLPFDKVTNGWVGCHLLCLPYFLFLRLALASYYLLFVLCLLTLK